jgi:selenocysteine lyase/cysteine desulfurase
MDTDRRSFLTGAGLALGALATRAAAARSADDPAGAEPAAGGAPDWDWVQRQFDLDRSWLHFGSFLLVSHPAPVRAAVERFRRELDRNPALAVEEGLFARADAVRSAAAAYLGGSAAEVAQTDSTTMGLAFAYAGLDLAVGDEILTTTHDHYSHHESIRYYAERSGVTVRRVALYDDPATAGGEEIAGRLAAAIAPRTRVVGLTWVHSSTGVKLPLRRLAAVVAAANRSRSERERILLFVDGVHGFGIEDETIAATGVDLFAAGTHKWIFAPRGTGIVWARESTWARLRPTVPPFQPEPYQAWAQGRAIAGPNRGPWVSPGGFKAYEHWWAVPEAFAFHERIGRARVAERIHALNTRCKDGLAAMKHVKVITPRSAELSAGIICFEVAGMDAERAVRRLHALRVVASASPYRVSYARLAPSLLNDEGEVDRALAAVATLA